MTLQETADTRGKWVLRTTVRNPDGTFYNKSWVTWDGRPNLGQLMLSHIASLNGRVVKSRNPEDIGASLVLTAAEMGMLAEDRKKAMRPVQDAIDSMRYAFGHGLKGASGARGTVRMSENPGKTMDQLRHEYPFCSIVDDRPIEGLYPKPKQLEFVASEAIPKGALCVVDTKTGEIRLAIRNIQPASDPSPWNPCREIILESPGESESPTDLSLRNIRKIFHEQVASSKQVFRTPVIGDHACDMAEYVGLTETYKYCRVCDKKEQS